jgi:hypothetical protein
MLYLLYWYKSTNNDAEKSIRQERSKIRRAGGADFGDAFLALLVQKHKF